MALPTDVIPTSPEPSEWVTKSVYTTLFSDPISGKRQRQTRRIGDHVWELMLRYNPMYRSEFAELAGFLELQQGTHQIFGALIPNLSDQTGLAPGNLLNVNGHSKVYRVVSVGNAVSPELFTAFSTVSSKRYSNAISVTNGVPIAVYFDQQAVSGAFPTVSLRDSTSGGILISDSFTTRTGKQLHILTPTSTDAAAYVEISAVNSTVSSMSIHQGVQISATTMTLMPTPVSSVENQYLMPAPACVMACSMSNDVQQVRHGSDRFVHIEVDLIERVYT